MDEARIQNVLSRESYPHDKSSVSSGVRQKLKS